MSEKWNSKELGWARKLSLDGDSPLMGVLRGI